MITNVLVAHPWLSPLALVLAVVVGPVLGARLAPRPRVARWLTAVSLLPVAVLTLVPVDRELYARCTAEWVLPTPGRVELAANVVLFVAPALLAAVATRRPVVVLLAASALSAAVEALQAAVPALGRSCDTSDWLANTTGAVLGVLLAVVALRLAASRGGRPARDGRPGRRQPPDGPPGAAPGAVVPPPRTLRLDVREDSRGVVVVEVVADPQLLGRTGLGRVVLTTPGPSVHLSTQTDLFGAGALAADELRVRSAGPGRQGVGGPEIQLAALLVALVQSDDGAVHLDVSGVPPRGREDRWSTTVLSGSEVDAVVFISTAVMGRGESPVGRVRVTLPTR